MAYVTCDTSSIKEKTLDDYQQGTLNVIRRVTANMWTLPVGTFKYKIFKYPGDIDIFERLESCGTLTDVKLTAAQSIQNIIFNIVSSGDIIFSEFKAGYDMRFKIYTGVMRETGEYEDYNKGIIVRDISNLYESLLITYNEYQELLSLVKDNPNIEDISVLNERLRDYWVIRWSAEEVLKGFKVLRGNYKLFLDTALTHKGQ